MSDTVEERFFDKTSYLTYKGLKQRPKEDAPIGEKLWYNWQKTPAEMIDNNYECKRCIDDNERYRNHILECQNCKCLQYSNYRLKAIGLIECTPYCLWYEWFNTKRLQLKENKPKSDVEIKEEEKRHKNYKYSATHRATSEVLHLMEKKERANKNKPKKK